MDYVIYIMAVLSLAIVVMLYMGKAMQRRAFYVFCGFVLFGVLSFSFYGIQALTRLSQ